MSTAAYPIITFVPSSYLATQLELELLLLEPVNFLAQGVFPDIIVWDS